MQNNELTTQAMIYFIPTIIVCVGQCYLLFSWFKSRRNKDGKEKLWCLYGFLLGQLYLLWEIFLVKQTGKPLPGSPEQNALMGRLALGGFLGGVFTIIGLFYVSFAYYGQGKNGQQKD